MSQPLKEHRAVTFVRQLPLLFSLLQRLRRRTAHSLRVVDATAARICAYSGFLSSLYYAFVSGAYRREHQATLAGRVRFDDRAESAVQPHYRLRRNIHRLEKGLIMRPRRPVFALDYIDETVTDYLKLAAGDGPDSSSEASWAKEVLQAYFATVADHPALTQIRARFAIAVPNGSPPDRIPYQRGQTDRPPVSFEQLRALAIRRRSVRWYLPEPVPRTLIDKALEIAALAPSACNRQPFEFRVYDQRKWLDMINRIPIGTTGFKEGFPLLVVLLGHLWAYPRERDRHLIYIDGGLAAMSFMFALETLGLSSCAINWPDAPLQEAMMSELLDLSPDERVVMLISVGFADPEGGIPYSAKKDLSVLRSFNR